MSYDLINRLNFRHSVVHFAYHYNENLYWADLNFQTALFIFVFISNNSWAWSENDDAISFEMDGDNKFETLSDYEENEFDLDIDELV